MAGAQAHPEVRDRTIWEMPPPAIRIAWGPRLFEAERASLIPYAGPFDGFHAIPAPTPWRQTAVGTPATVSKTCLVRFDTNKYSVLASAVGRPVEIRAPLRPIWADRIELRQDGRVVGEHRRVFGRGQTVYDPAEPAGEGSASAGGHARRRGRGITCRCWHASRAPCATARRSRIGCCRAPSSGCGANWPRRPAAIGKPPHAVRIAWDPGMVEILSAVLTDGLSAVEVACAEALADGVHSADVVLNILAPTPHDRDRVGAPGWSRS